MPDKRLRDPFRNEADAFWLLLVIGGGVALVVVAALIGGPWLGVPVGAVLLALGARASYRWLRVSLEAREGDVDPEGRDG